MIIEIRDRRTKKLKEQTEKLKQIIEDMFKDKKLNRVMVIIE